VNYDDGDFLEGGIVVYAVDKENLTFVDHKKLHVKSNPQSFFIDEQNDQLHVVCTGVNDDDLTSANDGSVEIFSIEDNGLLSFQKTLTIAGSPTFSPFGYNREDSIIYLANNGGYLTSYSLQQGASEATIIHDSSHPFYTDENEPLFAGVAHFDDKIMISAFNSDSLLIITEEGELETRMLSGDGPHYLLVHEEN